MALCALLIEWNKRAGGQLFGSSTGFTMPDKSVLSPDAAWISAERWHGVPTKDRADYAHIVPDICIEVASRTDHAGDLIGKLQRYRAYGASYVLLVDPYKRATWSDGVRPFGFPTDFISVFDAGTT
jgi:Uma2 family endonuclease